ncbi:MAG TPA: hypothetical protein VMZ71_08815 [Gemmataceae bacterium]|nr:hypothetical protein [Gemmataceae bacterium]
MRRVVSGVGLVVAVAGYAAFTAVGVAAWVVRQEVDRQVVVLSGKASLAADVVGRAISLVRQVIGRAEVGLAEARREASLPQPPKPVNPLVTIGLRQATRDLPGRVELARDAVVTASDAVVVVEAALEVLTENPEVGHQFGVQLHNLHASRTQLDSAANDLRGARTVLGIPIPGQDLAPISPELLRAVDESLTLATQYTNALEQSLEVARDKIHTTKSRTLLWSRRLAIGATVLAILGGAGMVFMGSACWRRFRTPSPQSGR